MNTTKIENANLKKLHTALGKTVQELSNRLGRTSDPEEAEAILREMEEVNFRVTMTGRLLFHKTTTRINQRIGDVVDASAQVKDSIKRIEKTKDVVKAVGNFLTTVDKILDGIKVLAL